MIGLREEQLEHAQREHDDLKKVTLGSFLEVGDECEVFVDPMGMCASMRSEAEHERFWEGSGRSLARFAVEGGFGWMNGLEDHE